MRALLAAMASAKPAAVLRQAVMDMIPIQAWLQACNTVWVCTAGTQEYLFAEPLAKNWGTVAAALGLAPALPTAALAARAARVMCAANEAALNAAGADEPGAKPFSLPSTGRDPSQGSSESSPAQCKAACQRTAQHHSLEALVS